MTADPLVLDAAGVLLAALPRTSLLRLRLLIRQAVSCRILLMLRALLVANGAITVASTSLSGEGVGVITVRGHWPLMGVSWGDVVVGSEGGAG